MTVKIELGWWLLPAAVTLLTFGRYLLWERAQPPSSGYGRIGDSLVSALFILGAAVVSLLSWLIWALIA